MAIGVFFRPVYFGVVKYTDDYIDIRLVGIDIKRIDRSQGSATKITFQCLKPECMYVWKTRPATLLGGQIRLGAHVVQGMRH